MVGKGHRALFAAGKAHILSAFIFDCHAYGSSDNKNNQDEKKYSGSHLIILFKFEMLLVQAVFTIKNRLGQLSNGPSDQKIMITT
jgi:hypothetical protein